METLENIVKPIIFREFLVVPRELVEKPYKTNENCKTCYGKRGAILKKQHDAQTPTKTSQMMEIVDMIKVL